MISNELRQELRRGRAEIRIGDALRLRPPTWGRSSPDLLAAVQRNPEQAITVLRPLLSDPDRALREAVRALLRQIERCLPAGPSADSAVTSRIGEL